MQIGKLKKKLLKFESKDGNVVFTKEVSGVQPIFMMHKAVKSVENERPTLQRQIRLKISD